MNFSKYRCIMTQILARQTATALYLFVMLLINLRRRTDRFRSVGVQDIYKRRRQQGDGHNLIKELRFNSALFFNYTRLNYERYVNNLQHMYAGTF